MKQVNITNYGTAEVLTLIETDIPTPGPGQILIEVKAAGVNFSDILRRRNTYFMPTPLPYVLGAEAVGNIVELGEGVGAPFVKGAQVLAILPSGGAYSQYVVAQAEYCVPLPPNMDPKAASAIFVQGSTAHLMVEQLAGDLTEKTVLVHAGAGGVGSILIQLGKRKGAKVIATASSEKKLAYAKSLGADLAINYSTEDWPERLIEENGGEKVDLIFEMVGGDIYTQSFRCLNTFGKIIVYGAASGKKGLIHSEHFVDESHQLMSFNLAHFIQFKTGEWQASLGAMIQLIASEQINISDIHVYTLDEVAKAHQDIENRLTVGKVTLVP
ncbi:MAG: zinc-binding dehydrogenase [Bacteroidota bacterium]